MGFGAKVGFKAVIVKLCDVSKIIFVLNIFKQPNWVPNYVDREMFTKLVKFIAPG